MTDHDVQAVRRGAGSSEPQPTAFVRLAETLLRPTRLAIAAIVVAAVAAWSWGATANSPVYDGVGHLASGVYSWRTGRLDAYSVNPPLPRLVQTLPVLSICPEVQPDYYAEAHRKTFRREWPMARTLITTAGADIDRLATLARLANLPMLLLGGWLAVRCLRPGRESLGGTAVVATLALALGDPQTLAWSACIMPEVWSSVAGLVVLLAAVDDWERADEASSFRLGLAIGFALATKFTWLLLVPIWSATPVAARLKGSGVRWSSRIGRAARGLAVVAGVAWVIVGLAYGFADFGRSLSEFTFVSEPLSQPWVRDVQASWLGRVPIPLPADMIRGIDLQRYDFLPVFPSYLCGEMRIGGWPQWYLVVAMFKWPLVWIILAVPAVAAAVCRERGAMRLVWVTPLAVLLILSWNHQFTNHLRYLTPAYPFLHVMIGRWIASLPRRASFAAATLVGVGFVQVIAQAPNLIDYHNLLDRVVPRELVHGLAWADSTIDYGQNLEALADFLAEHPEIELEAAALASYPELVAAYGLPNDYPPPTPRSDGADGWIAFDIRTLCNVFWHEFEAYRRAEPDIVIRGSTGLYRVPLRRPNRRGDLPPLEDR